MWVRPRRLFQQYGMDLKKAPILIAQINGVSVRLEIMAESLKRL